MIDFRDDEIEVLRRFSRDQAKEIQKLEAKVRRLERLLSSHQPDRKKAGAIIFKARAEA